MGTETHISPLSALKSQKEKDVYIRRTLLPLASYEAALQTLRVVKRNSPVDRGDYKMGWTVKRKRRSTGAIETHLRNDSPHAGIIEMGARPFWPPLEPLLRWAERKAGDLALSGRFDLLPSAWKTNRKTGRVTYKGRASLRTDHEAVFEFAVGVQRKIASKGIQGRFIMKKALPYTIRQLDRAVKRGFRKLAKGGAI